MSETVVAKVPWNAAFKATDRCDRCGGQAYHRVTIPEVDDLTLLFCAHHGRDFLDPLVLKYPKSLVYSDLDKLREVAKPNVQDRR